MKVIRPLLFVATVVFVVACGSLYAASSAMEYRGFTIDVADVAASPELGKLQAAIYEQIDIVCAVGVPDQILAFFQSVPFVLVPAGTIPRSTPGLYGGKDRSVKVVSSILTIGHKPVLLHELLHAYHDQRLKGGFKNRDVLSHFERAKRITAFAARSHMMQNEKEYFACCGTTFLFGVTAQEPFERQKLQVHQPDVVEYLRTIFGQKSGFYAGSLQH